MTGAHFTSTNKGINRRGLSTFMTTKSHFILALNRQRTNRTFRNRTINATPTFVTINHNGESMHSSDNRVL